MEIIIKKTRHKQGRGTKRIAPEYDKRYGEWGRVLDFHSEDNTVDVRLDTGVYLKRVPVSSREWVVSGDDVEKEYNAGERDIPPKASRVFVMMPSGNYYDCFVLCSGFSTIDQPAPFLVENGEERIKERITPSGWHIIDDYVTGRHEAVSPDGKTKFLIDYGTKDEPKEPHELHMEVFHGGEPGVKLDFIKGEKIYFEAFGELEITHTKGKSIEYTSKLDVSGKIEGDYNLDVKGDIWINGRTIHLNE